MKISRMPTYKLIKLWKELDDLINVVDCFSVEDVFLFELVCSELDKRERN